MIAVPLVVLPHLLQQRGQQDVRVPAQQRENFVHLRPARIAPHPAAPVLLPVGRPERLDQAGEAAGVAQPDQGQAREVADGPLDPGNLVGAGIIEECRQAVGVGAGVRGEHREEVRGLEPHAVVGTVQQPCREGQHGLCCGPPQHQVPPRLVQDDPAQPVVRGAFRRFSQPGHE
ncbi:hypothetical protein [Streptomyces sp. NPDC001621]|uniref:hypothetical protein n=1 Tax=Streptomyces sp. NPDC001621 TaxID=3364594 RepID=UPI0036A2F374